MKKITPQNFKENIADGTKSLLKLARLESWNTISDNVLYIICHHSLKDDEILEWYRPYYFCKKKPVYQVVDFDKVIDKIKPKFNAIYDINLFVEGALKEWTIVEINLFMKSDLDEEYRKTIENNPPMLHCKIPIPSYANNHLTGKKKKFNINWRSNPIDHIIQLFFWKLKMKWKLRNHKSK